MLNSLYTPNPTESVLGFKVFYERPAVIMPTLNKPVVVALIAIAIPRAVAL